MYKIVGKDFWGKIILPDRKGAAGRDLQEDERVQGVWRCAGCPETTWGKSRDLQRPNQGFDFLTLLK